VRNAKLHGNAYVEDNGVYKKPLVENKGLSRSAPAVLLPRSKELGRI
jgi:hypothetical protein